MNVETTTEATSVPATRYTHVATVPAERLHELASREAFRELCGFIDHKTSATSQVNPDGSMTLTVVLTIPNDR